MKHFMYCPFTGLGLYGGFRGNRWLRNRIKVFKQFVVPSLQAQTNKNFTLWVSWRPEDRNNKYVKELEQYLGGIKEFETIFTFGGVCFWDDKYSDEEARDRLATALHESSHVLVNHLNDVDAVLMTIQPSDDLYYVGAVEELQHKLSDSNLDAVGYKKGYIVNYRSMQIAEYNPKTNPPFFTYKMPKKTFLEPLEHMSFTGPYKSHEYIGDHMRYEQIDKRGFMVGTHGENISTHFNHPYAGDLVDKEIIKYFGAKPEPIQIKLSIRKWIMRKLPHGWQRKLRYIFGEKLFNRFYQFIRN